MAEQAPVSCERCGDFYIDETESDDAAQAQRCPPCLDRWLVERRAATEARQVSYSIAALVTFWELARVLSHASGYPGRDFSIPFAVPLIGLALGAAAAFVYRGRVGFGQGLINTLLCVLAPLLAYALLSLTGITTGILP